MCQLAISLPREREKVSHSRDLWSFSHFSGQGLESNIICSYLHDNCCPESLGRVPGCWDLSTTISFKLLLCLRYRFCWLTLRNLPWLFISQVNLVSTWRTGKESTCQCRGQKKCGSDPWIRKIPWSRRWQPDLVFLPEKSRGQRSLVGYSPQGRKELDTTEYIEIINKCNSVPAMVYFHVCT